MKKKHVINIMRDRAPIDGTGENSMMWRDLVWDFANFMCKTPKQAKAFARKCDTHGVLPDSDFAFDGGD